jgi:hypothetical protein
LGWRLAVTKVQFSEEAVDAMAAALASSTDPARSALLLSILRAWAEEDLHEHLSREGRAATRYRERQLQSAGTQAQKLIKSISALDRHSFFQTAFKPQMHHAGTSLWETDVAAARQRRDSAISWLVDLAGVFNGSENDAANGKKPKPPPDRATRSYLILRDLAAIFELVSGEEPTRRIDCCGRTYGPFAGFTADVWVQIFGNTRGISYAVRVWADEMARQQKAVEAAVDDASIKLSRSLSDAEWDVIENRFREYSPFVANIQFRHPGLWRKLRRTPR